MILNKKQLSIAQKNVEELKAAVESLHNSQETVDLLQVLSWKSRIEDLEEEINEYKLLENAFELNFSKDDLLKAVISLRIASGMTQKQLAEAIEIQEQQIQRYEQDYYRTASFERIVQILRVLSADIQLKIDIKNVTTETRFQDIYERFPNAKQLMEKVQKRTAILEFTA